MTTEQMQTSSQNSQANSDLTSGLSNKDSQKILDFVNKGFTRAKNDRAKYERQWYINLAFYFGRQNIQITDASTNLRNFKLFTPPAPYYRSRPVINRIRPLMRTEMSKLTSNRPTAYVVPSTSDDRDMYAASAAEQIWDSLYNRKKFNRIMKRAVFWTCMTGNGFIKTWWDENEVDGDSDQLGDICFESVTPFNIFIPDLKESEIEDQPWVIHAVTKNTEQLEMMYGTKLQTSSGKSNENLISESFANVMGTNQDNKPDQMVVFEMWIKKGQSKMFPDGAMISATQNQILQMQEGWPYEHNQYPFAHFGHVETGKFYRDSVITDLIPLQREYNRTKGQIIEAKNRMSKPQLLAEEGSLDPGKVTSEPGQIILYRPGFNPPRPLELQEIPSYVLQELDRIQADMNEISGQHEIARGQTPQGISAATAISYLQEQDDTKLSFTYDSIEEGTEKIAYQSLMYVQQFWDTPRQVKTAGQDSSFDVMAFQGSDLRGNTDIRIESGSALPTSRAAKQAFIMDLMKMGFIDPQKGLEVMDIGGIDKIYEQLQTDLRQAMRENLKMAQVTPQIIAQFTEETAQKMAQDPHVAQMIATGQVVVDPQSGTISMDDGTGNPIPFDVPLVVDVNNWDNHQVHIQKHNDYRKSQAYDNLTPEAKQLFDEHVQAHIHAIVVGAQGAMNLPPGAAQAADSPEAYYMSQNGVDSSQSQGTLPDPTAQIQQQMSQGNPDDGTTSSAPTDSSQDSSQQQ